MDSCKNEATQKLVTDDGENEDEPITNTSTNRDTKAAIQTPISPVLSSKVREGRKSKFYTIF